MTTTNGNDAVGLSTSTSAIGPLRFATIDGLKIRFASSATTAGRPILLLCPWPESILAFSPTWEYFTKLGPVIAIDLPGFGASEGRPGVVEPEGMGQFIPEVLKSFDLKRPHAIGPDIGTSALLFAAANNPGLFSSLTIGGGATDPTDVKGILKDFVNAESVEPFKTMTGEQFVQAAVETIRNYDMPEAVLDDYLQSYEGGRFIQSVSYVRHYGEQLPRIAQRLAEIQTPCQIIVGRLDPYVPVSNAELLQRGLPKSQLHVLDCGHFAWEEASHEYGRLCTQWIQRGYAGPSYS